MKWRVLVSAPYFLPVLNEYRKQLAEHGVDLVAANVKERLSEDELLACIENFDGIICGDDHFTKKVLAKCNRLKVISKWGTGIDSIDKEAAEKQGIRVCNTLNAFTEPVADTVLAYILAFARNPHFMDNEMKKGIWEKIPGVSLRETTLGVIGIGNIGQAVIRRATAFGMKILAYDVREISGPFFEAAKVTFVSKERLLSESDFVSLNCDLNSSSFHLMGAKEFSQMKPTSYIINTARGKIIDERAMIAALQSGTIAGAGLDVFEDEPLPMNSPLRSMTKCLLAPHNSNSSPLAWASVHENTVKNLLGVLNK